jgi:hypothetical protein
MSTLLLTIAKMTMTKKKKTTSLINSVMNSMMILAEMEHGEISWENPLTIKV